MNDNVSELLERSRRFVYRTARPLDLARWLFHFENGPVEPVLQALTAVTDNRYVVMALICVFVFLMGMVFESTVTVLLLVPILSTLCGQYGFSMVHLGVVITLGNMIGLITPPVGMSLFVMSATLNKPVMKIAGYCKIWYFPLLISWLLIAFVEPLCMFIPNLLGIG